MACLLLGQASSFVAVYLFAVRDRSRGVSDATATTDDPTIKNDDAIEPWYTVNSLWALIAALEAAFVVFFAIFVLIINKKYIPTFFTTMTAKQFRIKLFREATTHQSKIQVLKLHPSYYASIRGEVTGWVAENYHGWVEERPEWFTDRVQANIPIDMIPEDQEKEEVVVRTREGQRRKSSVQVIKEAFVGGRK